jgi:hypothetical protein
MIILHLICAFGQMKNHCNEHLPLILRPLGKQLSVKNAFRSFGFVKKNIRRSFKFVLKVGVEE